MVPPPPPLVVDARPHVKPKPEIGTFGFNVDDMDRSVAPGDDFVRYAQPLLGDDWPAVPLVGGRVRLARLEAIFAPQRLPKYVPQANR